MRKILNSRFFRLLVCLVLICCFLVNSSPIRAKATGLGGIIQGGAAGVGLSLSAGQVAILLLGAFGVYYVARHADELGRSLENALSSAVSSDELAAWWESAKTGAIDLLSAPAGIASAVKDWAAGFINGSSSISVAQCPELGVGSVINTHGNTVEVTSCASSVYSFIICYNGTHYTRIFSRSDFSVSSSSHINAPSRVYRSGIYFYYTGWSASGAISDMTGHNPSSDKVDNYTTLDMMADILSNGSPVTDVYPDVITGGITDQINQGIGMDVIGIPDIVIPGTDVLPVNPDDNQTQADAITDYLIQALINGDITWEEYWKLIGVYNPDIGTAAPTIDITNEETGETTKQEISSGNPVTPAPIVDYQLDLSDFFPFCIPFDLFEFFKLLHAEPVAPVLYWEIQDLAGQTYSLSIDLSEWDSVALLFRRLQLFLFVCGLAAASRKFIKW